MLRTCATTKRKLPVLIVVTSIILSGCASPPKSPATAPVSQVLTTLDLVLISTAPYLCQVDPDCEFTEIITSKIYEEDLINALIVDIQEDGRIKSPDCTSFKWAEDPKDNIDWDEPALKTGKREPLHDPQYKLETIIVDLKTVNTKTISGKKGVVLVDNIFSLTSGGSRSQKRIKTDQRKITSKLKKPADMVDRYMKAYAYIHENDKNQNAYKDIAAFNSEYLFSPNTLATEISCALETYMAHNYVFALSELELKFAFQLTDTKKDDNKIDLKFLNLSISTGATNEEIDDHTHTITIKIKPNHQDKTEKLTLDIFTNNRYSQAALIR